MACRRCGAEFDTDEVLARCPCGSADVELLQGRELRIHDFASDAELAEIFTARAQLGGDPTLRDLFDHLREKFDYFQLRMAALYHKRLRGQ